MSNPNEMRQIWSWALSWYLKPPSDPAKRVKQADVVSDIKERLGTIDSLPELHHRYCGDHRWCLQLAKNRYPREWPNLGLHALTATSYAIRYVEIITDRPINPREQLPRWIKEWAVW